jgi:hypothetical protein
VIAFLKEQKFFMMDWPGNLPENLLLIIKGKLKKKDNISALQPAHQGDQGALRAEGAAPSC